MSERKPERMPLQLPIVDGYILALPTSDRCIHGAAFKEKQLCEICYYLLQRHKDALQQQRSVIERLEAAECTLCREAAEYIRTTRRQHNEGLREEQRAQRDAYQEGRWAEREEQQQW